MAEEFVAFDQIDRQIIDILRTDGRIPWHLLGERVHLSPNAAAERARRLQRRGVITGYGAQIDQAALGRNLEAVVEVRATDGDLFRQAVLQRDEVTWMAHVTGRFDFQLHVACDGTPGLDRLLMWFKDELTVVESLTTIVLRRFR
jgi:Lrp/AsnC family transcriptional regulator, leucine-responsive regulatory protein